MPKEVFRIYFNEQIEAQAVLQHAHINIQLLVRVQPSPAADFLIVTPQSHLTSFEILNWDDFVKNPVSGKFHPSIRPISFTPHFPFHVREHLRLKISFECISLTFGSLLVEIVALAPSTGITVAWEVCTL